MNKDNAKDYLPLVQALAKGKVIQLRVYGNRWIDESSPVFTSLPCCYRIKPEPKELWVNEYGDIDAYYAYDNKEDAERFKTDGGVTRHYREVIE